ncbi:MAG: S49 family peptidase, partial [Planctomycetota bacterium]|nr:S49 family peptidase [Planctomycetota bacterium]
SMGNVAGSGGYYVSTLADTIFAEPATITGSIGVVGGKIVTKGFWEWIGVTAKEYKRGKLADTMSTNRRFTDEQRVIVMDMMNRIYSEFKDRVAEGRGDRIKGDLESLAGGRVYTGRQALENGLVDRLGGLADAIKFAANQAELGTYDVRVYPRPKTIFDVFSDAFGGQQEDNEFVSTSTNASNLGLGAKFGSLPGAIAALDAIRAIDPVKAAEVENFMIKLEMLSNEGILLITPALATFPQ